MTADEVAERGVVVVDGYDLAIRVIHKRLVVEDGVASGRRVRRYHRATGRLRRLVVIGRSGTVTLEALGWLADIRAAFVQLDRRGTVLSVYGPPGTDRPVLRRAQAMAQCDRRGLALSRWLVDRKLAAQADTLGRFPHLAGTDEAIAIIAANRQAIVNASTVEELRSSEAFAAGAYWQALAPLEVRFARRDAARVPDHWRTFGGRGSPIANGPRLAANPANALLNYAYGLLEAEATLSARIVGLDPGLGVMHADQPHRDSLSADLMEPIRPLVDAYAFELLTTRPFAAGDFHETRIGVCRVTPPLTHELALTLPRWRELVGRIAEDFAAALDSGDVPTSISGRRRAEGRPSGPRQRSARTASGRRCGWCGGKPLPRRATCSDECAERILAEKHREFAQASSERMTALATMSDHPALSAEAQERRRTTRREQRAAELAWDSEHSEPADRDEFVKKILPNLHQLSARTMSRATGLSVSYCGEIKRGERVPHQRWWEQLGSLVASG